MFNTRTNNHKTTIQKFTSTNVFDMKLLDKYEKHQEIYNQGYLFDADNGTFFTDDEKKFIVPPGYEDWKIEIIDFQEYGKNRLKELGINKKNNSIQVIGCAQEPNSIERFNEEVFSITKKGNIEILQYGLDRRPIYKRQTLSTAKERNATETIEEYRFQTRLHPINEPLTGAKYDFTNAVNAPFWSPSLLNDFETSAEIETLVITEGQFKAFKACLEGINTVGLTSISHFRDKETKSIHPEIIEFIKKCSVSKVVVLWDGDCTNISSKDLNDGKDLSKRPGDFYRYAQTIKTEIKKYIKSTKFRVYFATIKSDIIQGEPKGIDDLLTCGISIDKIKDEFSKIGDTPTVFLHWNDITTDEGMKEMRRFFALDHQNKFYEKHRDLIREKSFVFYGNTYRIEKGSPILEVSKDIKSIKRIEDEYYQLIDVPVPNGKKGEVILETRLKPRKKTEILQDYGKDALNHIEKFKGFTNVANHIDYQHTIHSHWNLYYNVDHKSEKGDFPTIKKFLLHLFEEHEENEMIYDYLTLLYRNPMQKLPVVCLVSKHQETGKSTFIYLLKLIFKQNLSIISNHDLVGEFNAHWTSSLIVASEETLLEKKDGYEKIKSLSTAFEINRNEKNKTSAPIPCMIHFVFASNHEDDFIKIDDYDSRLWIRKIKPRTETIENFDQALEAEIPFFVNFLETREIKYKSKGDRLFFAAKDFMTDAKKNLIVNSEPGVMKDIRNALTEYFYRFGQDECKMTIANMKQYFQIKGEINYLNKIVKTYLKAEKWKNDKGEEGVTTYFFCTPDFADAEKFIKVSDKGRPYVFKREDFIKTDNN